ncbi:MAG: 5'/3'-nucleotidase SurE [Bacteroidales bacterium]|nr:5'/3'-nucleotidase SurE [Bacteroidales bacterium]
MGKPLILITNDDGFNAPGIKNLTEFVRDLGDICIVAPERPQSAMGHAVTISSPLRLKKLTESESFTEYTCSGTPADAVKLALDKVVPRRPDIILSGINHGANSSVNVIYSGTMSAAIEGSMSGITAIGFSLLNFSHDANFLPARKYIRSIVLSTLNSVELSGKCLNVNIPDVREDEIRGIKICRQAKANWEEEFDERLDPHNNKYYWLKGVFKNKDNGKDTDEYALSQNYISIVPITIDFTEHSTKEILNTINFNV